MGGRGHLGSANRGQGGIGQELETADGTQANPEPRDPAIGGELRELRLYCPEDSGDLGRWPVEVLGGEDPERDGRDAELAAPLEEIVELLGPMPVGVERVRQAAVPSVPAVAHPG